jgi:hypothetical protein
MCVMPNSVMPDFTLVLCLTSYACVYVCYYANALVLGQGYGELATASVAIT